jgi:hypothetical protein
VPLEKRAWAGPSGEEESKNFFFEKKKQKTFAKLDRAGFTTWGPD